MTDAAAETIPPYLANGVIGMRLGRRWLGDGVCIVDGLAAIQPGDLVEGFARAPFPLAGDLDVDGARYADVPELARLVERRHDFSCGEITTRFEFGGRTGPRAAVEVLAFASRTMPMCALQQVSVNVDAPCDLALTVGIDPTGITGRYRQRETRTPASHTPVVDGWLEWETYGRLTRCGGAYTTVFEGRDAQRTADSKDETAPLRTTYRLRAMPGETYTLRQVSALVPSTMHNDPARQAIRLAAAATERGFDALRDQNRESWAGIWRARIKLTGADQRWQQLADAAFYYLQASAHRSSLFSTSMFGLAYWPNYHYYQGHSMWDVEGFAFPPLLLTQPETAEALLEYRYRNLPAARMNSALNGYEGFQFPWASGPTSGQEAIRTNAPLINFEQHVTPAVARAFTLFARVTNDDAYRAERSWTVLEGAAKWILSRVRHTDRGYEVPEALGVAEQAQPQDNNIYMNLACASTLRDAAGLARDVGRHQDAELWQQIAGDIYVPREESGELAHCDGWDPSQSNVATATPEALAAILIFGARESKAVLDRTLRADLDRVEPYIGYPMLNALLGPAAAWLGDRDRSANLYEAGYADYIRQPYLETDEFSRTRFPDKPETGPFMANIGGFLSGLMLWLPRIRIGPGDPAGWGEGPITMPSLWDEVEVGHVVLHGREAAIRAKHGAPRATIDFS